MQRFPWGKVLDRFEYDFDGVSMEVTKYHPFKNFGAANKEIDTDKVVYHCEELHSSAESMFGLLIVFIAQKQLGLNQHALAAGICKMLDIA